MEAVGQLTGGVAHDFNNLLTVVLGNLEMLEDRLADPGDMALLKDARDAALLGAELTRRLLAFGRRQPLRPRPVDPLEVVPAAVVLLRRTLGEMTELVTVLAPGLPPIMVDPGQLQNALLNLAINARDAMPGGGRLTIEAAEAELDADAAATRPGLRPGRYVVLAVADTGTGMTPEVRERAFEPFFTTKGPGPGPGSACRWSTASSSRAAVISTSTASSAAARSSSCTCPWRSRRRRPRMSAPAARRRLGPAVARPCWWWRTSRPCAG